MFNHKIPADFPMQTLRKKTSPCKYKNEPGRFLGEGVAFRAKLIGVLEVTEARGDRMCQEALAELKMAIRAAGEHKQRIQVHVAIDGLRLRDDKTGDSMYHHPVHKISFIAQDMTDSRAFGYIFGSPDSGHRFFGIKTDKAASQVVIAMRDLFQVVFELKKKEIELAKQQLEGKVVPSSGGSNVIRHTTIVIKDTKSKTLSSVGECSASSSKVSEPAEGGVAELVDLEQELSSLRRGLTQVEGLTPSTDPFGDSFIMPATSQRLLPPPPGGGSSRGRPTPSTRGRTTPSSARTGFSPTKATSSMPFDLTSVAADFEPVVPTSNALVENLEPPVEANPPGPQSLSFDVFTELDPLGTGRSRPYVDKKLFFQELKNPPKKQLKDLVATNNIDTEMTITSLSRQSGGSVVIAKLSFASDPFAETDPFDSADPFTDTFKEDPFLNMPEFPKSKEKEKLVDKGEERGVEGGGSLGGSLGCSRNVFNGPLQVSLPPEPAPKTPRLQRQTTSDSNSIRQRPQRINKLSSDSTSPPPPLPPKKPSEVSRPPPRPPHDTDTEPAPELPPPARIKEPMADRTIKPRLSSITTNSSEDEYLTPVPPPLPGGRRFDITLSQLLTCSMSELATRLRVPEATLSSMTLPQLTAYLRSYLASDIDKAHIHVGNPTRSPEKNDTPPPLPKPQKALPKNIKKDQFEDNFTATDTNSSFVANFDDFDKKVSTSYDRYAAFREIQEQELKTMSLLDPLEDQKQNGDDQKPDSDKEEMTSLNELVQANQEKEAMDISRSPLKSLDELTLDSFNLFRNSVSPKPTQIESKIEDIKNVMKNLQIEQSRRSVTPRDNSFSDPKVEDSNDRYAALREITITEPPEEFESLPPEAPKERKRSDEKSDGFDNSDFFDCIDNSSLSFSHVDDAFRKSPSVHKDKIEEREVLEEKAELPQKELVRELVVPQRVSTESLSDVASVSSPDTKDKSIRRVERGGRWSVVAASSPWSSDSRDSECAPWRDNHTIKNHRRHRQTSSSSRDVSPWEEEPPPVTRHHRAASRHRESRHNSSQGSRECLDSGSGRDKDKLRDKHPRDRDGRESVSTRERDRRDSGSGRDKDRDRRDRRSRDRDYSRERDYRDSKSRERLPKDYRDKESRHRKPQHSWDDEEDYSDGGGSGRSSPRERWPEHRYRREERNYGSLGWRETRRRAEIRQEDPDRRYGSTLSWSSRRPQSSSSQRRDSDRRRLKRDEKHNRREQRFSNEFSPRDRDNSPFDNEFIDSAHTHAHSHHTHAHAHVAPQTNKRPQYASLDGSRFAFDTEDTTSPLSANSTRARDGDSPATRFRFDSESVSPRSMFEDDFTALSTPRARAASIAEEDEADLPPLRNKPTVQRDIKKSESVNIFVRETDPFEGDDFFACTGSDRAARRDNWPGDFQAFDNV